MGAATYVGRVGRLAVALGIGTAIATGNGVAWADDSATSPNSSSSSGSTQSAGTAATAGSGATPNAGTDTPAPPTAPKTEPATTAGTTDQSTSTTTTKTTTATTTGSTTSSTVAPGVVVSAQTTTGTSGSTRTTPTPHEAGTPATGDGPAHGERLGDDIGPDDRRRGAVHARTGSHPIRRLAVEPRHQPTLHTCHGHRNGVGAIGHGGQIDSCRVDHRWGGRRRCGTHHGERVRRRFDDRFANGDGAPCDDHRDAAGEADRPRRPEPAGDGDQRGVERHRLGAWAGSGPRRPDDARRATVGVDAARVRPTRDRELRLGRHGRHRESGDRRRNDEPRPDRRRTAGGCARPPSTCRASRFPAPS